MVAKMIKWSPWPPLSTAATRKFQVKVKPVKLQGFDDINNEEDGERRHKVVAIKMRWKGAPRPVLVPFHRTSKQRTHFSTEKIVKKGQPIQWDDEFENTCSFSMVSDDNKFAPWDVSFTLFYGEKGESKAKLGVIGKVSLNLAEMATKMESRIERDVPINLQVAGVSREATLLVLVSFLEMRDSQDSSGIAQSSTESGEVKHLMGNGSIGNKNETKKQLCREELSLCDSEIEPESGLPPISDTQSDPVKKVGLFSWKRRRLSTRPAKMKCEPLIEKTNSDRKEIQNGSDPPRGGSSAVDSINSGLVVKADAAEPSSETEYQDKSNRGNWEAKELVSRDGQTKLKAQVFFATFDQCSDKAAGESACTALVAVIAHWLQSNQDVMPTRSQLDNLIIQGSSEWRKLCDNKAYVNDYPDKHFDLETVLHADVRPIAVSRERSFIGFFGPEKFESLKGAMSFDEIWVEISCNNEDNEPRIYIVSWNDHFFILKTETNAYYIIDTLGERLFEGCNQAYILRFDDATSMQGRRTKEKANPEETAGMGSTKPMEEFEDTICTGKECCREYIKRFLAAIPLKELEKKERKEAVSYYSLHQRLQIEFNFSSLLSFSSSSLPFSSSATTSSSSLLSNEECFLPQ